MKKNNVVIVGTGSIGLRHLDVLHKSTCKNILAFPTRNTRRVELESIGYIVVENWNQAKDLGATHAIIATDTLRHPEDIQSALVAGCNVLSEKPLAVDTASAYPLLSLAKTTGKNLYVGTCLRFQEALITFRNCLEQIGSIHSVRIECQSYLPDWRPNRDYKKSYSASPVQGGVLRDLIHEIDYACWIYGWPSSVTTKLINTKRLGIDTEEIAELLWQTTNGAVISIGLDYLSRPSRRQMKAYGEFGSLEWDGLSKIVKVSLVNTSTREIKSQQPYDNMYRDQDLAFLTNPSETQLTLGEDGLRALAICDAARLSSREHTEVKVDYPMEA